MSLPPGPCRAALKRPIFLVSPPRSGSTLLFETLAQSPSLATVGGESHGVIEGTGTFHPATRGWHSNRLTDADIEPETIEALACRFLGALRSRDGAPVTPDLRMLEKTPKNSLRVPFLAAAWPEATFLFLQRPARPTLSSMIEAWQSGHFRTYPRLPDWPGGSWSMLLVPGWRTLAGLPLPEIVARQWAVTVEALLADLSALSPGRVLALEYDQFIANPQATMEQACAALGVAWDRTLDRALPASPTTVTAPAPDKWRRHAEVIESVWPIVAQADAAATEFAARHAPPMLAGRHL
ncbi:MAG: sulfotransferase [Croceibacterium sp.]